MIDGRKNWKGKLASKNFSGKKIWIHCASLGEFEQGRPLIERIKASHPTYSIIITFFSSSGYEVRKDYAGADYVCYLPFDGPHSSQPFVDLLNPDLAIFVKYEFWYYYLKILKKRSIPTISISAIFRPEQLFFKKRGYLFREMLSCFDHLFVQNQLSKELLDNQGFQNVTTSGDTRFDRVVQICSNPTKIETAEKFKGKSKVMVIGSSWPDDMKVLYPLINNHDIHMKYIIAPHEIEAEKIRKLCNGLKVDYQLLSKVKHGDVSSSRVLIVDSIGLLSSLYQYGDLAYIGGAFGDGLHNILEAATYGMPILFGRGEDNFKYQEAIDLVELGGAFEVENSSDLVKTVNKLLNDALLLKMASDISKEYVKSKTGATDIIMDHLNSYLA